MWKCQYIIKAKMRLDKPREQIWARISRILSSFPEITECYIFGSFLRGEFRDIDLAILLHDEFSPYHAMKFAMKVGRKIEKDMEYCYEFDVRVLNFSPIQFQYEVIKKGKLIFSREERIPVRYEAHLLSQYLDYKQTSDWFDQRLLLE